MLLEQSVCLPVSVCVRVLVCVCVIVCPACVRACMFVRLCVCAQVLLHVTFTRHMEAVQKSLGQEAAALLQQVRQLAHMGGTHKHKLPAQPLQAWQKLTYQSSGLL